MMFRTFGLAFILALTGAVTPGPVLALVIAQVLARGIEAAVYIMLGHAVLEFFLVLGLAGGMKNLLVKPAFRTIFGMAGGLVLLWMGWGLLQPGGGALNGDPGAMMSRSKLFLAGIGVSLSNPYFTGWWATVGTGQVAALKLKSLRDYGLFFAGHELGDLAWYLFIAVVLATGRQWMTPGVYGTVLKVTALAIMLLGAGFLLFSLGSLRKPRRA